MYGVKELILFITRKLFFIFNFLGYCLPVSTLSSYGQFLWNFTKIGEKQVLSCTFGNGTVWRSCQRNVESFASWKEPNFEFCLHSSEHGKKIDEILKVSKLDVTFAQW